jgi:hypothetical protein
MRAYVFRSAPESRHCAAQSACQFRANFGHSEPRRAPDWALIYAQTGIWFSSHSSCQQASSRAPAPLRDPCRGGQPMSCGRKPIPFQRRCGARGPRSARRCRLRSTAASAKRKIGRRPMCIWMPTGFPALSSTKSSSGSFVSTGLPSRSSDFNLPLLPTICSGMPHPVADG